MRLKSHQNAPGKNLKQQGKRRGRKPRSIWSTNQQGLRRQVLSRHPISRWVPCPRFGAFSCSPRSTTSLYETVSDLLHQLGPGCVRPSEADLPLPFGATFKPTHSRWNHSRLHPSASQATISP